MTFEQWLETNDNHLFAQWLDDNEVYALYRVETSRRFSRNEG